METTIPPFFFLYSPTHEGFSSLPDQNNLPLSIIQCGKHLFFLILLLQGAYFSKATKPTANNLNESRQYPALPSFNPTNKPSSLDSTKESTLNIAKTFQNIAIMHKPPSPLWQFLSNINRCFYKSLKSLLPVWEVYHEIIMTFQMR